MILKRMKRRHLRQDVIDFCKRVREIRPDVVFGADIIAGFPTETDEMFENSLKLVEECNLTYLHVFPYSPRPGTPAARMPQVEKKVIKERAKTLRALGILQHIKYLDTLVNQSVEIMTENATLGRTPGYAQVTLPKDQVFQEGMILRVKITNREGERLQSKMELQR
jgi:threonylcarbamoyladenosine tRNA methylthiotransferase MtaB